MKTRSDTTKDVYSLQLILTKYGKTSPTYFFFCLSMYLYQIGFHSTWNPKLWAEDCV